MKKKDSSAIPNLSYWNEKIHLLTTYLAITKSLNSRSSLNDLPEISKLLDQRQEIIKNINSLNSLKLEKISEENNGANVEENFLSHPPQIKKILLEIEVLDKQLSEKFTVWREEVKKELMANQLAFRTIHTYAQTFAGHPAPRFLDTRK